MTQRGTVRGGAWSSYALAFLSHDLVVNEADATSVEIDETAWALMVSLIEAGNSGDRKLFLDELVALPSRVSETQHRFLQIYAYMALRFWVVVLVKHRDPTVDELSRVARQFGERFEVLLPPAAVPDDFLELVLFRTFDLTTPVQPNVRRFFLLGSLAALAVIVDNPRSKFDEFKPTFSELWRKGGARWDASLREL